MRPPRFGLAFLVLLAACRQPRVTTDRAAIQSAYDAKTGRLHLLTYDSNRDGKPDMWSYMDGVRIERIEIDKDGDSKIDRWEYYTPAQTLEKVGVSRANDGKPDAWLFAAADGTIDRAEVSTRRDGTVNRIEHYSKGAMTRAEEDSDGDGKLDRWETYEDERLVSVAFDTRKLGRPEQRFFYRRDGSLDRVEEDTPAPRPALASPTVTRH